PPIGWPVFFVVCVFVIVWVQWVVGVQSAVNELAVGGEGFEAPAERVPTGTETGTPAGAQA
ncbi:MAG: hypothetical protein R6X23_13820, partial [Acidimicrobiia bacterium]